MQNRVTVTIAGQNYTLLAAEDTSYVEKVAAHVDESIRAIMKGGNSALLDAAILTAMNLADENLKHIETEDNLQLRIKECLDDAARLEDELSNAKREIFRLQNKR